MILEAPEASGRTPSLMVLSSWRPALPLNRLLCNRPKKYVNAGQDHARHFCRELDAKLGRKKESNSSNDINPECFTIPERCHAQSLGSAGFDCAPTKAAFLAGTNGLPSAGLSFKNADIDGVIE